MHFLLSTFQFLSALRSCPSETPADIRCGRISQGAQFACYSPNTRLAACGIYFPTRAERGFVGDHVCAHNVEIGVK